MAKPKLKQVDGHFVESDYENALIIFLEREGWQYLFGDSMSRANRKEVLPPCIRYINGWWMACLP